MEKPLTIRIRVILSIIVVFLLLWTPYSFISANEDTGNETPVSSKEVQTAARYYISKYINAVDKWEGVTDGQPVEYVWPNGGISAYEIPVMGKTGNVGFMFISATKDYGPLFELSNGKRPSEYVNSAKKIAIEKGLIKDDYSGKTRLLYYGALTYSVQFGEEMISKQIAIHLPTGRVEQVPAEDIALQMDTEIVQQGWVTALGKARESTFGTRSITWIFGVPAWYQNEFHGDSGDSGIEWPTCAGVAADPWDQWDGCSAISGAMVLGYWDTHGYSMGVGGEDLLIDHAHHYMGTDDDGDTMPWNIDDGMWLVANMYQHGDDFSHSHDWSVSFSNIVDNVDRGTPAVLNLRSHPVYGNHSVTVVGYEPLTDIWVNNTWDTSQHLVTHGSGTWATLSTLWPD